MKIIIGITVILLSAALLMPVENGTPVIRLEPEKAVYGTPFSWMAKGFKPGESVRVTVKSIDRKNRAWESTAVYKADTEGEINPSAQAPAEGEYKIPDVYGLLYTMHPVRNTDRPAAFIYDPNKGNPIEFTAAGSSGSSVSATLHRYYEDPDKPLIRTALDSDGMKGTLFSPADGKKYPAVILLSGSNGGSVHWLARAIASRGFAVLDLPYWKLPGLPKTMVNIPLEYFLNAIKWIKRQSVVTPGKIGLIGGSRGGELALLLGTVFDEFDAIVGWVPAAHLWQGEDYMKLVATWTWKGEPLPYIGQEFTPEEMKKFQSGQMTSFRNYFLKALKELDPEKVKAAAIPVEKIKAPVMLVSGSDDQTWPSTEFSDIIMKRLKASHFPHETRHLAIKDGGHLVFLPDLVTWTFRHYNGGTREQELKGSLKSWNETIRFLKKYLNK